MITLLSLFTVAFLAATFLPLTSEIYFLALLAQGAEPFALVAWASLGNTLGAAVNWWIGKFARGTMNYEILDISGKLIARGTFQSVQSTIDISSYASGMYLLRLQDGRTLKFIKE